MGHFSKLGLALTVAGLWQVAAAAPGDAYIPGRLSVRFKEMPVPHTGSAGLELGLPELDRINRDLNGLEDVAPLYQHLTKVHEPDLRLNFLLEFDNRLDMESVAALYMATGLVEYAEPDYVMPVSRVTNDPSLNTQWYLTTIQAREAWDSLPEDPDFPDMIIAVIDSGVDWNHPDLRDIIWTNPDEDLDGDGLISTDASPGEVSERNGVDDGQNGYVDDFYGWDWVVTTGCANGEDCVTPDNNPRWAAISRYTASGIRSQASSHAIAPPSD